METNTEKELHLPGRPAPICSPIGFSKEQPSTPGGYFLRCMENDQEPEWVAIYDRAGCLRAVTDSLGDYPLNMIHDGLTDVTWKHGISVLENAQAESPAKNL